MAENALACSGLSAAAYSATPELRPHAPLLSLFSSVKVATIESFLHLLKNSPPGAIFNPWWQMDEENDFGPQAPRIRRTQLRAYIAERIGSARFALVGEALGYRGGHFTGIAMTSERMLLAADQKVLSSIVTRRTSKPEKNPRGFSEPTASMVWTALLGFGLRSDQFVLWNAFPWHPFDAGRGTLTNRKPSTVEQRQGTAILKKLLQMFRCEAVIAVGGVAAAQLEHIGHRAIRVRHPANAGAALFRQQLHAALHDYD
jgi:uracil-DNA glycosylase